MAHFKQLDLRPLEDTEQAGKVLQELDANGVKVCVGVGAIPSIAPESEAEKLVYAIADTVFKYSYEAPVEQETEFLNLPKVACFLEMAYKVSLS